MSFDYADYRARMRRRERLNATMVLLLAAAWAVMSLAGGV
jgi:hypothetical protein